MIQWLVQTEQAHGALGRGAEPAGLLAPEERRRLARLVTEKRRRDWLLGRWTAKQLLVRELGRRFGLRVPLDAIVLRPDSTGAPRAYLALDRLPDAAPSFVSRWPGDGELPLTLSLSHRSAEALCAVSTSPRIRVGVDLEIVEHRSPSFVADYLTDEEQALVQRATNATRDRLINTIWSSKEAVLKALRLGLTVDTRRVCCLPEPGAQVGAPWRAVRVRCDPELWRAAGFEPDRRVEVRGWWHAVNGRIRTLAAWAMA